MERRRSAEGDAGISAVGSLLLPRGELPLNIFEPRYLAMIDDALATHRMIGHDFSRRARQRDGGGPALQSIGCAGRMTQFAETGDGRYLHRADGRRALPHRREKCRRRRLIARAASISRDFGEISRQLGEEAVDRESVLRTLREFAEVNKVPIDWDSVHEAPNEALVNALSMMSPYGPREKQALLEAPA